MPEPATATISTKNLHRRHPVLMSMPNDLPSPASPLVTPSAFLEILSTRLDRLHDADAAPVLLRAIPVRGSISKDYGGFVYASLRDPRTSESLDGRIPVKL